MSTSAVLFGSGTGNIATDSGQLIWDAANNRLEIGLAAPLYTFHVHAGSSATYQLRTGVDTTGIAISAANNGDTVNIPMEFRGSSIVLAAGASLLCSTDNVQDIGAVGSGRPRNIYAGTSLIAGSTAASTAGAIRLGNNAGVFGRTVGGSSSVTLIDVTTGDVVRLGPDAGVSNVQLGINASSVSLKSVTTPSAGYEVYASLLDIGTALRAGSGNASTSGPIRLPNNNFITERNAGNTSDIGMIGCDTSNRLNLEANSLSVVLLNALTQTTVSSTGAASSLPVLPVGYIRFLFTGTERVIPFYNQSS